MAKYYLIDCLDGEAYVEELTKREILEMMGEWQHLRESPEVLDTIPSTNPAYWKGKLVIIKGEIVTPRAKQVVTEYEID